MYAILMREDGSLTCTTPNVILYQTESFMDNVHFFIPKQFKDVNLVDFAVTLKYVSPANVSKIEILNLSNDNYSENYMEYVLPVTTELTSIAGNIKLYLTFMKIDETKKYIGHSSELTISINPVDDYFTNEESLQAIDKRIMQLQTIANQITETKADLTANGEKIGDSIVISGSGEDPSGEFEVVEF